MAETQAIIDQVSAHLIIGHIRSVGFDRICPVRTIVVACAFVNSNTTTPTAKDHCCYLAWSFLKELLAVPEDR